MAKLTLSVDSDVVLRAKQYAKRQGLSVSEMVEAYLADVSGKGLPAVSDTPVLRSVRGILKRAVTREYKRHLAAKYR